MGWITTDWGEGSILGIEMVLDRIKKTKKHTIVPPTLIA